MRDEEGNNLDNPIVAYLCRKNGNTYENVTIDANTEEIDAKVSHEVFGDVYLFSKEPISAVGGFFSFFTGSKSSKRYALFLENEVTIDNGNKRIIDYMQEKQENASNYEEYDCISFNEYGNQFWVVKQKTLFTEIL